MASCSAKSPVSDQTEKADSEGVDGGGEDEGDLRAPCFSREQSTSEEESSEEGRELDVRDRRGMGAEESGGFEEEMMAVVPG